MTRLRNNEKCGAAGIAPRTNRSLKLLTVAGNVRRLAPRAGYSTPIKDGYLNDVEAGDFSGNGHKELIFLETNRHYISIVHFTSQHKLAPAVRWKVFEEHTFNDESDEAPEPREALAANVTGHKSKKRDLVVVVNDRILVYPQE